MWLFGKKKKSVIEECREQREFAVKFFSERGGIKLFKKIISVAEKEDTSACPLSYWCSHHFAKWHDKDYPNFFVDPCWTMIEDCLCPLMKLKEGCDGCERKINNSPLC